MGTSFLFSDWDGMLAKAWVGAASETEGSNKSSHNQTARARRRGNCCLYSSAHSESLGLKKKRQYGRKQDTVKREKWTLKVGQSTAPLGNEKDG